MKKQQTAVATYSIPMIEVNPRLKREFDRGVSHGRAVEAKNILRIGQENDGVNLFWLAMRVAYLEAEASKNQNQQEVIGTATE